MSPGQEGGQRLPWSPWGAAVPGPAGAALPGRDVLVSMSRSEGSWAGVELLLPVLEELQGLGRA